MCPLQRLGFSNNVLWKGFLDLLFFKFILIATYYKLIYEEELEKKMEAINGYFRTSVYKLKEIYKRRDQGRFERS